MINARVIELAGVGRQLMGTVRKRQLKFLGHLLQQNCLENEVFFEMIEGRRARGRQRRKYATSLLEDIQGYIRVAGLVQLAQDRREWHSMVIHVEEDMALR